MHRMESLARSCRICVLATVSGSKPHSSLMGYVTNENCREIYMATYSDTRKYQNLQVNPSVSILIDTRTDSKHHASQAMTVEGKWEDFRDENDRKAARDMLLSAHPQFENFLKNPKTKILRFTIQSFLLLDGLTDAYYETVG